MASLCFYFQQQRFVKAISGHVAPHPDYLSFKKGNIIKVYNKKGVDPGCMWGVLNGAHGMFPSSCVEEFDVSIASSIFTSCPFFGVL